MKLRIANKVIGPAEEDEQVQDIRLNRYRYKTVESAIRRQNKTAEGKVTLRYWKHIKEILKRSKI